MRRLVFIQRAQGKYVEAEKTAGEYLKVTTATYGPNHIDTHEARYTFAITLIVNNKLEEAETIFLSLIDCIEKEHPFGPDHQYNFLIQNALSSIRIIQAHATKRELGRALKLAEQALRGREKMLNFNHPDILAARKWIIELRTMKQGIMGANIDLDKTDSGSSEKKQKKKRSFFGSRSRASSNATPVETGSHADGASTEKKKTAYVAVDEMEKTNSYDSTKGIWKSSLGLFGMYLYGDTDEKIEDKEIELTIESDSDDDGTGENLDNEKSAAFTNNPLRPPPLPPRPAVDTQFDAITPDSKDHDPKHSANMEIPSQTVPLEDTIESTVQQIRRRPITSRPSRYHEQRKPELKPDASELPAERVVNPAARLDGPGWDASPFGA
ncbi:MAG: hypothetical protein Q9187_004927 [Circinaria calcarea]